MDHEFRQKLEFTFLLIVQLALIGFYVSSLFPSAARSQTPPVTVGQMPTQLGAFLDHFPIGKSAKLAKNAGLMRLGEGAFVGYRVFKGKKAVRTVYDARERFRAECKSLGGHFETKANPSAIAYHFSSAKKLGLGDADPAVCVDDQDRPLGALFASSYSDDYGDSYVSLFVMTKETTAEMMAIYHQVMAKELQFQKAIAERKANNERNWAAWRDKLAIGTDTNCGPVISLRGPMAEIANGEQATWFRREQLFPLGARDSGDVTIRCGLFDPL
jgi:hypothetical protein